MASNALLSALRGTAVLLDVCRKNNKDADIVYAGTRGDLEEPLRCRYGRTVQSDRLVSMS